LHGQRYSRQGWQLKGGRLSENKISLLCADDSGSGLGGRGSGSSDIDDNDDVLLASETDLQSGIT